MAKRAVLIGVNRCRMPGSDLRGYINDIKNTQATLTQSDGFDQVPQLECSRARLDQPFLSPIE